MHAAWARRPRDSRLTGCRRYAIGKVLEKGYQTPFRGRNGFDPKCPGMNSIAEMGRWMGGNGGWAGRGLRATLEAGNSAPMDGESLQKTRRVGGHAQAVTKSEQDLFPFLEEAGVLPVATSCGRNAPVSKFGHRFLAASPSPRNEITQ